MIDTKTQNLINKYGGPVPRYTSYPTAVQFHNHFTSQHYRSHMGGLSASEAISIYVHIPFCHSLCYYCGCHTRIVHQTDVISSYVDTLCQEIIQAASLIPHKINLSRIHLGGGTPNYAASSELARILETIRRAFSVEHSLHIDIECDPRLLNDKNVAELSLLGVRRVSLGVQDFDHTVQQAINRIQPLEDVQKCVASLRNHHIADINFDLIIGLPKQTLQSVQNTVHATLDLRPSRIAVFPYAHVPWMKQHQKVLERYHLPTTEERYLMQNEVDLILKAGGYMPIGVDHYALQGNSLLTAHQSAVLHRNFQGYTDDDATIILGFGLSAISQFKNAYAQNTTHSQQYKKAVEGGHFPISRGVELNDHDILVRNAIMRIMCDFQVDIDSMQDIPIKRDQLDSMLSDGLIVQEGHKIRITDLGKPFVRVVASCFDSYFTQIHENTENRHSQAI